MLRIHPIDALVSIGIEARNSGEPPLSAGVFKVLTRYFYPQRKAVNPVAAQQPQVIQVITRVSRCSDDLLEDEYDTRRGLGI